jgi:DNA-binding XRE family transcriptional regulator
MDEKTFGPRLRALRERIGGYSQEALAREAELSTATVSKIEQGIADPSWTTVLKLFAALKAHLPELSLDAFTEDVPIERRGKRGK